MKLAWATDIHLDFLESAAIDAFAGELDRSGADGFLVGGDIAKAGSVERHLRALAERLQRPIWFVLGNHDFYIGSIARVREAMRALSHSSPWLRWMPEAGVVPLTRDTALVGHDGWGDARLGNFDTTPVRLNDFLMIEELSGIGRVERNARLRALGDDAAAHLAKVLPRALEQFPNVVVLTHVPPFREACWHDGAISNDDWLPYFTCAAVGDVLRAAAARHPERTITVLCGHTHGGGTAAILPNLRVLTGGAAYGRPRLERLIEVS